MIVCIALPPAGDIEVGAKPANYVFRNVKIMGSLVGNMQDTAACLDYARRGMLKGVAEVRGRSRWAESVQQLKNGQVAGRIVIDLNQE